MSVYFTNNSIIDVCNSLKYAFVVNKKEILNLKKQTPTTKASDGLTRMKMMVSQIALHPTVFQRNTKTNKNRNQAYLVGKCFSKKKNGKNSDSGK